MNIIPVKSVGQGTETGFPSKLFWVKTFRYSGLSFPNIDKPSINDPCPNDIKAKNGISRPPISKPIPFRVSLTATDFRPPNIIRIALTPLYNSFQEVYSLCIRIKSIVENEEFKNKDDSKKIVP